MATITAPSATEVRRYCGLDEQITGESSANFDTRLASFISDGTAEVALAVGESQYDGSNWTTRGALVVKRAIAFRAGAGFLADPATRKRMGTQEPLLMEDGESIEALIERMLETARRLEQLASSGHDTEPPFALPTMTASTFVPSTTARTPSQRNALIDERDDISAWDEDTG